MVRDVDRRQAELVKKLREAGWRIRKNRRNCSVVVYPPDPTKEPVSIHASASDSRTWRNTLTHLRRAGWRP